MQALIPKATLLQGLRPNLNEGDHCVFPPGFRVGKILPKGGSPFKQGEILQGGTQISYIHSSPDLRSVRSHCSSSPDVTTWQSRGRRIDSTYLKMATPKLNYTAKELSKMDRQDLIDKFIEQQSFAITSLQKFAEVNEKIANLATEMAIIKKSIPAASSSSSNISERMEREHYQMQQYSRRDCIELVGVPTSVEDKNLEKKSLEILKSINVEVQPSEVQACHRMFDKKRFIIKFLNRKTAIECLKNRSKLKTIDRKKFGF